MTIIIFIIKLVFVVFMLVKTIARAKCMTNCGSEKNPICAGMEGNLYRDRTFSSQCDLDNFKKCVNPKSSNF